MRRKILTVLFITLISAGLFSVGFYFLLKYDIIRFDFTDNFIRKMKYEEAKRQDRKVLVLGDSQLENWSFERNLYKDMEAYFGENDFGYLNAAHHGFGPMEYADQFSQILKYYIPDLVLVFYYAGNDLSNVSYRIGEKPLKRKYPVVFEENDLTEILKPAEVKEENFDWEKYQKQGIDPEIIQFAKNRLKEPNNLGENYINPFLLDLASWKPNSLYDNLTLESIESNYGWYHSLKYFEKIKNMADSISADVAIIVIPHNVQIDTSQYDFYRKLNFRISDELLFSNSPQFILYNFCKYSQVRYLDLSPFFKTHPDSPGLYLKNDEHLSENGQILSFDVTRERILENMVHDSIDISKKGKKNYYKKFEKFIVLNEMEIIRKDSLWFNDIKMKARKENRSVESQLYLDALYMVEHYGRSDE